MQDQLTLKVEEAINLLNSNENGKALQILESALLDNPGFPELNYGRAVALGRLGRVSEAIESLVTLVSARPQHAKAQVLLDELKEKQTAEVSPQGCVAGSDAERVNQLLDASLTKLSEGNVSAAMRDLIEAKKLAIPLRDLDHTRAMCFITLNKLGDAREALLEELRFFPDNEGAKGLLAQVQEEERRTMSTNEQTQDREFQEWLRIIRPNSMLPEIRLYFLYTLAKHVCGADIPGNFVECGVAGGGSSALLSLVIKKYSRRPRMIFSCDSFQGMPKPGVHDTLFGEDADATGWGTGTCAAPEDSLLGLCKKIGTLDLITPVKGFFENTLPVVRKDIGPIAFMHIDCDWYESTLAILNNLYDQVSPGAMVQIDDYGYWEGVEKAVKEFEKNKGVNFGPKTIDGGSAWFERR